MTCEPKQCSGNPSNDKNVQDCQGEVDGAACNALCYPGYTANEGSDPQQYTCVDEPGSATGQWKAVGTGLTCTAVTCDKAAPKGVANALQCEQASYDRLEPPLCVPVPACDAPCDEPCLSGFNYNPDYTPYTCDRFGEWTQTETHSALKVPLTCDAKPCKGYPATVNAGDDPVAADHDPHTACTDTATHPTCPHCENGRFQGSTCQAQCSRGYQNQNGVTTASAVPYTCLNTLGQTVAHWGVANTTEKLVCRGVPCDNTEPGSPYQAPNTRKCQAGAYADSGHPDFTFSGTVCRASCKDGYEKHGGSSTYVCDNSGAWVVGDGGGATPEVPDLDCKGKSCGEAPHGFASTLGIDVSTAIKGQVWPYVKFEACTQDYPRNSLYYSDDCTGDCTCTGTCAEGYSEDGTSRGVTSRTFQCRQSDSVPYIWHGPSSSVTQPHDEPLACMAISCGDVMAFSGLDGGGRSHDQHLVPSSEPIGGEYKRCGGTNGVPGDGNGVMRYDRDPDQHNNVCVATCAEGYTVDDSSQEVQYFTCGKPSNVSNEIRSSLRSLASDCSSHADCESGEYCNGDSNCDECSHVKSDGCDAIDDDCCSAAFRAQCANNPGDCSENPGQGLPWAVAVNGSINAVVDGIYIQSSEQCNGKSVFRKNGQLDAHALFQPNDQPNDHKGLWLITAGSTAEHCENRYAFAGSLWLNCATSSPVSKDCLGKWNEVNGSTWVANKDIEATVAGFTISGAKSSHLNGFYAMTNMSCHSSPVYATDTRALYRPDSGTQVMIGSLDAGRTTCVNSGYAYAYCAHGSPDAADCAGTWVENTGDCGVDANGDDKSWCPSELVVGGGIPCVGAGEWVAPGHADSGDCPAVLSSGASCEPKCSDGFDLTGQRWCENGQLHNTARCKSTCSSHADCESGEYCDIHSNCYECSYVTFNLCDAIDDNCCSAEFIAQCPGDPADCSPEPEPEPGPEGYSGNLRCTVVTCADEPLEAISSESNSATNGNGCTQIGAHANRSTWEVCKTSNQFQSTCAIQCATGFTDSRVKNTPVRSVDVQSYQCKAIPNGAFHNGDPKFLKYGVWTYGGEPPINGRSPSNLQCLAVRCDPLKRPRNTKFSKDDHFDGQNHFRTDEQLRDDQQPPLCVSAGYRKPSKDILFFGDHCQMECLSGWYPAQDPNPPWPGHNAHGQDNRTVTYTCAEPGPVTTVNEHQKDENGKDCPRRGSSRGVWCPGPCCTGYINQSRTPNEALFCKEGTLDPTQSRVDLSHDEASVQQQLEWPKPGTMSNSIKETDGSGLDSEGQHGKVVKPSPFLGWRFGGSRTGGTLRGPQYKFVIETRDTYGNPRDYNNLHDFDHPEIPQMRDFVVVVIERVPIAHLKKSDRDLQPTGTWDMHKYPSKPGFGSDGKASEIRPYEGQTKHVL
eukprot:COSAG01_NODE_4926_length_4616_cov_2.694930_1_plen_1405_part_00